MSIIWADSFDHYGTTPNGGRDFMLNGAWAEFVGSSGVIPRIVSGFARTGTYALYFPDNGGTINRPIARRIYGTAKLIIGNAFGIYLVNVPDADDRIGWQLRNVSNAALLTCFVQSDGSIEVRAGSGTGSVIVRSDPCLRAASYDHVEFKTSFDDVVGSVEIRVNGVTVINETGLNLGTVGAAGIIWGCPISSGGGGSANPFYIDDVISWDDAGTVNNDFIGQQRVLTQFCTSDTAAADWTITGSATGYGAIDDTTPDDDTSYISGVVVNDISEFGLPTLPPETDVIAGVYIPVRAKLVAAGVGNVQVSMLSVADVSNGPDQALTTGYSYYGSVHELDPDTDLPWTKAALEAALVRVEKTV